MEHDRKHDESSAPLLRRIDVVCLVLQDAEGRVLATRRPPDKSLGGMWEFPGGKVEPGESAEDALRREIHEELGMEIGEISPLTDVTHHYDFGIIHLIPYLASVWESSIIHLSEHTEMKWILPAQAGLLDWAPADLPILEELTAADAGKINPH